MSSLAEHVGVDLQVINFLFLVTSLSHVSSSLVFPALLFHSHITITVLAFLNPNKWLLTQFLCIVLLEYALSHISHLEYQ